MNDKKIGKVTDFSVMIDNHFRKFSFAANKQTYTIEVHYSILSTLKDKLIITGRLLRRWWLKLLTPRTE
jgi:hypothetical protein